MENTQATISAKCSLAERQHGHAGLRHYRGGSWPERTSTVKLDRFAWRAGRHEAHVRVVRTAAHDPVGSCHREPDEQLVASATSSRHAATQRTNGPRAAWRRRRERGADFPTRRSRWRARERRPTTEAVTSIRKRNSVPRPTSRTRLVPRLELTAVRERPDVAHDERTVQHGGRRAGPSCVRGPSSYKPDAE